MRDDFGISVHPVKVALNQEDVLLNDLPSDMDAKPSSPHYKKFVAKYGTRAVELDAAPVKLLQDKLRDVINSYLDVDVFNTQIEEEAKDAALLEAHRKVMIRAIGVA